MIYNFKRLFSLDSRQQLGILSLLFAVILVQCAIRYVSQPQPISITAFEKKWCAMQRNTDSLHVAKQKSSYVIRTFNPNFIDDAKGYFLGMSTIEIDRLLEFRKSGKFVNSAEEFQQVTKVCDTLLNKIAPQFKFPNWIKNKHTFKSSVNQNPKQQEDINVATADNLMAIYGIGPGFSNRILALRDQLGAFVSMEQMGDVYGLPIEVVNELQKKYCIVGKVAVKKININSASLTELASFPYFRYAIAREILAYRSMNGGIKAISDLEKIKNFPTNRLGIISLYLEL
jgi:DNA uptake protein ComE-like DNA-binding protein